MKKRVLVTTTFIDEQDVLLEQFDSVAEMYAEFIIQAMETQIVKSQESIRPRKDELVSALTNCDRERYYEIIKELAETALNAIK